MKSHHKVSRRSFLQQVAGGTVAAGALLAGTEARAIQNSDSDPTDPAGRPRSRQTSDTDPTDPAGRPRGTRGSATGRTSGGARGGSAGGIWQLREIRLYNRMDGAVGTIVNQRHDANGGQVDIQVSGNIHDFCRGGFERIRFLWAFPQSAARLVAGGGISASLRVGQISKSTNCRTAIASRSAFSLARPDTASSRALSAAEYGLFDGDRVMPGNGFRAIGAEGPQSGVGTLSVNTHQFDRRQPRTYFTMSLGTPAGQVWYLYIYERTG